MANNCEDCGNVISEAEFEEYGGLCEDCYYDDDDWDDDWDDEN
jgi:NMD protein affecting ribosome stability and mRNA decay